MLTGAGADRMQSGMQHSYGKTVGIAAKVKKGTIIVTVATDNKDFTVKTLKKVKPKLPCKTSIVVEEIK